ncbi:hypothetical protein [Natrinema amylolyticum]|uniref:hypothetical protein n=1 Tax=Natrinema amylolyticum TaxID=2878679 RepID=UPI00299E5DB8|nr:hypothetical protein [Natrinema amylolyticum]
MIGRGNVNLENGVITGLEKSQQKEEPALPEQAIEPLRRLEILLDLPADGWPVFPSRYPPSLYAAIDNARLLMKRFRGYTAEDLISPVNDVVEQRV